MKVIAPLIAVLGVMCATVAYSPTLYRMFCAATGYGGTTQRVLSDSATISPKTVTVEFDSNVAPGLPWRFEPLQRNVTVHLGEQKLVFFTAENTGNEAMVGHATFNVTPQSSGIYFNKIQCFCIEEFVTGRRDSASPDLERVLATVLFTDIVDSTQCAAQMGDEKWRKLLDQHDRVAGQMVENHRGKLVKSTGDGILATFDGPGRAVRCALSFGAAVRQLGLPLRAGLHTGEIEVRGRDIGGITVHAAARVMAQSGSNEVLVSRVVTDLVAGADLKFSERGSFELKGLPGRWDLFAASM